MIFDWVEYECMKLHFVVNFRIPECISQHFQTLFKVLPPADSHQRTLSQQILSRLLLQLTAQIPLAHTSSLPPKACDVQ